MGSLRKFQVITGRVAGILIVCHIVLATIIVISPEASQGSRLLTFYRRFVVLGPFFQKQSIVASPHLLISERVNGVWTAPTASGDSAESENYRGRQWTKFGKYLGRRVAKNRDITKNAAALRELEAFARLGSFSSGADSVAVTYVVRSRGDGVSAHSDTVYTHRFGRSL